jgi:type II secretory pathway pseudopilin PulG
MSPENLVLPVIGAVVLAALLALIPLLGFVLWRRTRRSGLVGLAVLWLAQLALLSLPDVRGAYVGAAEAVLPWLGVLLSVAIVPGLLLLWRRTRRVGLVLLGTSVIASVVIMNYYAQVICSIGYVLLLLALWPRWRLMKAAPVGREKVPVIPSRGVLRARLWPACRRPEADGFTLITSLVGIICLLIAASMATQMIAATMVAVRRADHMAVATDLVESARERSLLGRELGGIQATAARLLPKGQAAVTHTSVEPGVTRVTAVATWRETDGKPGHITLEWLTSEGPR